MKIYTIIYLCIWIGGSLSAEVYNRGYVGCYNYTSNMDQYQLYTKVPLSADITLHLCIQACLHLQQEMKYAGFMRGTDCYCGNGYNQTFLTENEQCSLGCLGNTTQKCGYWNKMTIFNTEYEKIPLLSLPMSETNFLDIWNFPVFGNSFNGTIFRSGFIDLWTAGTKIPEYVSLVLLNSNGQDLFSMDFLTNFSSSNVYDWMNSNKIISSSIQLDFSSLTIQKNEKRIKLEKSGSPRLTFAHGQIHSALSSTTVFSRSGTSVLVLNRTDVQYLGCMSRLNYWHPTYQNISANISPSTCQTMCRDQNMSYFLLQGNSHCYCTQTSNMDNQVFYNDDFCNIKCQESSNQTCGSRNNLLQFYHVTTLPPNGMSEYCLHEDDIYDMKLVLNFEENKTRDYCLNQCTTESFKYALYKEYVRSCFCSNEVNYESRTTNCPNDTRGYYSFYDNQVGVSSHVCQNVSSDETTFIQMDINVNMTVDSCILQCFDNYFMYSVLLNAQICFCSNQSEGITVNETECLTLCIDGNHCGGSIGYVSVYKDLYVPNYSNTGMELQKEALNFTTITSRIVFNADTFINGFKLQGNEDEFKLTFRYTTKDVYYPILGSQWLRTEQQHNFDTLRVTHLLITLKNSPPASSNTFTYTIYTPEYDLLQAHRLAVFGFYHEEEPKVSKWEFLNGLSEAEIMSRLQGMLSELSKEAAVSSSNLSSTARQKTSAVDKRTSSKGIGILGTFFIGLIFVLMLIADIPVLKDHLKICWSNVSSIWSTKSNLNKE